MQRGPISSLDSVTSLPDGQYQPPHPLLWSGRLHCLKDAPQVQKDSRLALLGPLSLFQFILKIFLWDIGQDMLGATTAPRCPG